MEVLKKSANRCRFYLERIDFYVYIHSMKKKLINEVREIGKMVPILLGAYRLLCVYYSR